MTDTRGVTGDCSVDCLEGCAYPGQFSECEIGSELDWRKDSLCDEDIF